MFSSGLKALDQALFSGKGIPPGSLIEITGVVDSGKTGLALWFCRTAMADPEVLAGWICAGSRLTQENLAWAGLDTTRLVVDEQTYGLPGLEAAIHMITHGCRVIVIDTLAGVVGEEEETPLTHVLSGGLYRLRVAAREHGALVLMTNQERTDPEHRVTRHAGACPALIRLVDCQIRLRSGMGLFRGAFQTGARLHFNIMKNGPDFSTWGKEGRLSVHWQGGLSDLKGVTDGIATAE